MNGSGTEKKAKGKRFLYARLDWSSRIYVDRNVERALSKWVRLLGRHINIWNQRGLLLDVALVETSYGFIVYVCINNLATRVMNLVKWMVE